MNLIELFKWKSDLINLLKNFIKLYVQMVFKNKMILNIQLFISECHLKKEYFNLISFDSIEFFDMKFYQKR